MKLIHSKNIKTEEYPDYKTIISNTDSTKFGECFTKMMSKRHEITHALYELSNVNIIGGWGLITNLRENADHHQIGWNDEQISIAKVKYDEKILKKPELALDGEFISLLWPGIYTYGHWLYDVLPRIFLCTEILTKNLKLILPDNLHNNYYQLLEKIGISYVAHNLENGISIEKLIIPSFTSYGLLYPLDFHKKCYEKFFPSIFKNTDPQKKYFLNHVTQTSSDSPRQLTENISMQDPLELVCDFITPSELSIESQIDLFSNAEAIAGVDSSAMHNLIMSGDGSKQLIIASAHRVNLLHLNISALKDTNLYINESTTPTNQIQPDIDFIRKFFNGEI
jgi:capsular polysaccharide biosynthesis protein